MAIQEEYEEWQDEITEYDDEETIKSKQRFARAQLDFVYKNSAYFEPTYMLYPVARILNQKTN